LLDGSVHGPYTNIAYKQFRNILYGTATGTAVGSGPGPRADARAARVALGLDAGPEIEFGLRQIAAAALDHIRAGAHDDTEVLKLIDHYERGAMQRKHVLAVVMTRSVYDNARRRLDRILATMPGELRESARSCWGAA
jgi:hypothetical protein